MRSPVVKRYLPDATTRAVWDDSVAPRERAAGVIPQRASRIEVIQDGPQRGKFHVDFSLLAEATGDDSLRLCLVRTFDEYSQANRAEVQWLHDNWVMHGCSSDGSGSEAAPASAGRPAD